MRTGLTPLFLLLPLALACGGRTPLKADSGLGLDGGPDLGPPELVLDCGRRTRAVPVGQPLELFAVPEGGSDLLTGSWSVVAEPPVEMGAADYALTPAGGNPTTFVAATLGFYTFRFDGTDERGLRASCDVTTEVFVDLPRALCPEPNSSLGLITGVGRALPLDALAVDDRGIASVRWTLLDGPGPADVSPPDVEVPTFVAEEPGVYRLRFDVVDIDGGMAFCETSVEVIAPPALSCSPDTAGPVGSMVEIEALPTSRLDLTVASFSLDARPPTSRAALDQRGPRRDGSYLATLDLDRVGAYAVSFTATDTLGQSAQCVTRVQATPVAPVVTCPTVEVRPLDIADVVGRATDDGEIVRVAWTLVSQPPGSDARPPEPEDLLATSFRPDIAGTYELELRVTDDDGLTSACTATVLAVATEGLRVEIFWDSTADMDTHLLNPEATRWFNGDDCYYANCDGGARLNWGDADRTDDDPSLDIDDTDGFGPENINIDEPAFGTYRVGVHAFARSGSVTVNVYCGGRAEPDATFGPRDVSSNRFWRVADVELGRGCTITELGEISSRNDAERRR